MPVLNKTLHQRLIKELEARFALLRDVVEGRELKRSGEGLTRGSWVHPEEKRATVGSPVEIRLAVDDFKNILAEFRKLK
ncbi:MAG: hypothetical protein KAS32_30985 [Candidatus Peribacteraceae bacterium]|nr:hypothetical protein [Candidatus Peribacteraceae bacterium]